MKHILSISLSIFFVIFAGCGEEKQKKIGESTPASVTENSVKAVKVQEVQNKEDSITTIAGLPWHSDIDTAFNIAQKEKKNVIVMVGEEYCKWCTKMKERTLPDVRIQTKFSQYILVSVKRSDKEAIKHVPAFDGNIPSFFFMTPKEEMVDAIIGYFTAYDFLQYF